MTRKDYVALASALAEASRIDPAFSGETKNAIDGRPGTIDTVRYAWLRGAACVACGSKSAGCKTGAARYLADSEVVRTHGHYVAWVARQDARAAFRAMTEREAFGE